ncbi:saccharopine dehydrogenase NADP-binding domain-containing protein [Paenibacillus arenosi]|uniref:Saccharopine dehydrogenase NADP-binding domain-containing protein n=1 Tax=Paenibacillus arenosi TaxID=2774142 RepID=A0ABR9B087_9BACL|nr:saccharopine dehydrogenase NADP-binding domain-containing protein [Paenibacillus arenosi]MBD8499358.1 saccharopine dehydrogenase NADP-binding domain-containing protein [Paenibacillus arenosi]
MIGIIGGYGEVGLSAVNMLYQWGKQPLRIGGRNPDPARIVHGHKWPQAEWVNVTIEDDESLESFVRGCVVVVNCAGPSHQTSARVAAMCMSLGCHHVDAGVDPRFEQLRETEHNKVVLYAAGATPGLSGLLPRWLAESFDRVDALRYYTGALDKFTFSAAEDYLVGVVSEDNEPMAAWKNSSRSSSALNRKTKATLPFFTREVTLYPYFDQEAAFVAASLSLRDGEWYLAIDGEHVPNVLEEVSAQFLVDRGHAIKRLCTATELDAAGRQQYVNFIVQLSGVKDGLDIVRTIVLQAQSSSQLTGWTVATAAIAVLEGEIPVGVRPLAEISQPHSIIDRISHSAIHAQFNVLECSIDDLLQTVEGEL